MPHSSRTNVLVVEDEAPIRQFLSTTLQAEGFVVFEAADAREGRRWLATAASICS